MVYYINSRRAHFTGHQIQAVTYTIPPHNIPNTQTIPTVSTPKDLGIVLNTSLSAEDNVVSPTNKTRWMLFYLKRSFAALTPNIFSPCTKRLSSHTLNMLFKQPIPPYAATPRHWKRCRSSLWSSWKGFGMSRMKQPLNSFVNSLSHTGEFVET